ncbi:hypothetical protein KR026_010079 [Drosophila bipectinata]|nr:hypothetical protein KR026_010079 [Drosophila bipectinata]
MEADITPAAETNGSTEISSQQHDNREDGQGNKEQQLDQQQQQEPGAKPVEAGVAGTVGEIIDYLEEDAGAPVDRSRDQDAEMGEAEYLDGERPEELDSGAKDKSKPDGQEEATEDDKEDTENDVDAAADKKKRSTEADEDEEAADEAAEEGTEGEEAGDEATEEGDEAEDGDADEEGEGDFETEEEGEGEGEIITGDEPAELAEGETAAPAREKKEEEPVDENQCRVCTSKEDLVSLFDKQIDGTPADMLLVICPNVSILPKDFMPQFICPKCLGSLSIAIQLRKQLESTEQSLRKRLSRSKNKVRRPRGYVVIDAPVSDSSDDEEELNDDAEFKVSDVGGSTSPDSDSGDSDESEKLIEKKKPGRPRKRPLDDDEEPSSGQKKKYQSSSTPSVGPFECNQCDLTFSRKQSYVLHRKTHERTEHTCQICGKKFKVEWAYKTHLERHENERASFRCELCSQVFRLRAELKRHMAVKHDEHGFIYECKRCQRTFLTQQRLQRHQSIGCQRQSEENRSSQGRRDGYSHGNSGKRRSEGHHGQGRDLFKSVAPLTTTYWSDSFSD